MRFATILFLFISVNLCAQDTIPPIFSSFWPTDTVVLDVHHDLSSLNQKIEATDNVDGNVTSSIKKSGSFVTNSSNQIGFYSLTYSVSDKAENSASKSVIISVEDRFAPIIELVNAADTLIFLIIGEQFVRTGAVTTDNHSSIPSFFTLEKVDSSVAGRYTVCMYAVDEGLNHSDTIYQTVCVGLDTATCLALSKPVCADVTVNIDKPIAEEMVMIYPNPSNGKFQIKSSTKIRAIQISDLAGHHWMIPSNSTRLDFEEARGMYLVRITTSQGIQNHKLLVE